MFNEHLRCCKLCPRECGVNRTKKEAGFCRVYDKPVIAAVSVHPWEEPPISGSRGSGAIFFSGCTMRCIFCQNYPISQLGVGREISVEELADAMLRLQDKGVHNINLVTPTHQIPMFVNALVQAVERGLSLPVVYNSSGYERVETLQMLEGIVDIYLPDIKYAEDQAAWVCSKVRDYVYHNRATLKEMWRQVGTLKLNREGIGVRGMLVRHLVLPEDLASSRACLEFLRTEFGPDVWISLMSQYFPAHLAVNTPPLNRKLTEEEYATAFRALMEMGFENGFIQDCLDSESFQEI